MKEESPVTVTKVRTKDELDTIFKIREEVFVIEQEVDPSEEYDEFEASSTHFLAKSGETPAGTARWRFTDNGVKLERFAVLSSQRGKGVGQALVKSVIDDIAVQPEAKGKKLYLHAQLPAVSLYARFGFEKVGDIFEECNILHYKMELYL
ncbi:Acetyltransferase [Indibacter alkaliphilus LW1]|jgi:predicted GNAT family N-acyltransferase|uniref:Acetyltransferase n=1 Tax=Indibacter alkaliphilus (strain CCUG 57479 / KCTC 22604 / LW1) TaxID=1189612 RepID=S2DCY0_INDAL|nr:GNAT family N-acetyltransferase [Indibacter alkaliphilus]EOZ96784.1 Acetyltransferase [Indibacter alkaliphilus LW1]